MQKSILRYNTFDWAAAHRVHGGWAVEALPAFSVACVGTSFSSESGTDSKVGWNDPCPCGSGKKYKKCCGEAGVN
jgi:SEC-C motif